ncbi:hypothetical protein MY11210_009175 [Beauveria gryllotalpidicola]
MFSKALALTLAAAGAAVQAHHQPDHHQNGTWTTVTEVVDIFTTFCPEPTHLTMNHKIYTVTEACTFTITDCPCTVTKTIPIMPTTPPTTTPAPGVNANPSTVPPVVGNECPSGQNCPPVVAGAGQNTAAYGMALAGAIAAAAIAL